jgi:NADPH-dependent 2,4-dienoyl-CoA reductase/sulfur reductase-like enzyme
MRLVVIGGVAAGLSAAARAKRLDSSLEVVVLEKGEQISYGACGLPYLIEGQVRDWRQLVGFTPGEFLRAKNVSVRTGAEAAAISHARREVTLAPGEKLHYDKLVIATGARARCPQECVPLHTLADGVRLWEHLRRTKPGRAVVLGAGYIGLELAGALRARGWGVTLVGRSEHLLGRGDVELTATLRRLLERHGVRLLLGYEGPAPEAELTVHTMGLQPNVTLAENAGVELGRTGAIRVSERMETNLAGVYAAGDCAETQHRVTGAPAWIPLGTTANKMGRVAGANVAGRRERFGGVVGTSIVRVCGLGVALTGLSQAQAREAGFGPAAVRIQGRDRASYFRGRPVTVELVADRGTGRLLGGSVLGEYGVEGRINVVATALQARMSVEDFVGLDLAYAPPYAPVMDALLVAAQQLMKEL